MDLKEPEQLFVNRFITREKQERYLNFLASSRTRNKFLDKLYHLNDFNWHLFREIPGSENEKAAITSKLKSKNISTCWVISANPEFDGRLMTVEEAPNEVVGTEASVLMFGNAEVIYYEGEAPHRRYLSL